MDSRIIAELVLHLGRITSGGTCASCEHLEGDGSAAGKDRRPMRVDSRASRCFWGNSASSASTSFQASPRR
jgi:hypothetical protein